MREGSAFILVFQDICSLFHFERGFYYAKKYIRRKRK